MGINLKKLAAEDAWNMGYAEMFFGEGAGTRRKLLNAELTQKAIQIPGYVEAFENSYRKLDWADLAVRAAKERKSLDRSKTITKNVSALMRGDRRGMTNGFAALVIVGTVAHVTGYDKIIFNRGKAYYYHVKAEMRKRKFHVVQD